MNKRDLEIRKRIYESKHGVLKEDADSSNSGEVKVSDISLTDPTMDVSVPMGVPKAEAEDTPQLGNDSALAQQIIAAINDEWEAIKGYNDLLTVIAQANGSDDMVSVIKDIAAEENMHVGQLQKVLETISPNVSKIAEGEDEAQGQLNTDI